jgi:hypothetical protein
MTLKKCISVALFHGIHEMDNGSAMLDDATAPWNNSSREPLKDCAHATRFLTNDSVMHRYTEMLLP